MVCVMCCVCVCFHDVCVCVQLRDRKLMLLLMLLCFCSAITSPEPCQHSKGGVEQGWAGVCACVFVCVCAGMCLQSLWSNMPLGPL